MKKRYQSTKRWLSAILLSLCCVLSLAAQDFQPTQSSFTATRTSWGGSEVTLSFTGSNPDFSALSVQSVSAYGGGYNIPCSAYEWWVDNHGNSYTFYLTMTFNESPIENDLQCTVSIQGVDVGTTTLTATVWLPGKRSNDPPLTISLSGLPQTVASGVQTDVILVSASGGDGNYTYTWDQSPDNNNWTHYGTHTTSERAHGIAPIPINTGTSNMTWYYRVTVTSAGQTATATATVTVTPSNRPLTISLSGLPQTVASGVQTGIITVSANGGSGSYTYVWDQSPDNNNWTHYGTHGPTTDKSLEIAPTPINTGTSNMTWYYRVTVTSAGQTATATATVTVTPASGTVTPSANANYIITYKPRTAVTSGGTLNPGNSIVDITYYDGLGRPEQQIAVAGSPQDKDVVTPIVYDAAGRDNAKQYLPYVSSQSAGQRKASAVSEQRSFYQSEFGTSDGNYGYVQNVFEASSLDRVVSTWKPGSIFRTANKKVEYSYQANTNADTVRMLSVVSDRLVVGDYYPANTLYKNSSTDEDGLLVQTFTDKLGRKVLERSTDGTTMHDTHYAYDDLGRLRFVISPEGSARLTPGSRYWGHLDYLVEQYCYYYEYDSFGCLAYKRIPGTLIEYLIYDDRDRLIGRQDGKGRMEKYWILYRYDGLDRLVEQRKSAQTNLISRSEAKASFDALWNGGQTLLSYTYDDYPSAASGFLAPADVPITYDSRVKGLKTYEKVAVLGGTAGPVERTFYYDAKGRLVQTVEKNHLGGTSRYTTEYDFIGNVLASHESHTVASSPNVPTTILTTNAYDHRNRLELTTIKLNDIRTTAQVSYEYDELGRLQYKTLGENLSTIGYSYNIQGWNTGQTSPNFTSTLYYYGRYNSTSRYTGSIALWEWWNGGRIQNNTYYYDRWNRLTDAYNTEQWSERGITYDRNGNFNNTQGSYTYTGNQLTSKDGISGTFAYDKNGNMTINPSKGLTFSYNFLNLPEQVKSGSTIKAYYLYDANGRKLNTRNPSQTTSFDYLGSLVLAQVNGAWSGEVHFGDGVIRNNGDIEYFEKDHLGSVRVVLSGNGTALTSNVLERNDYWPFSGRIPTSGYPRLVSNRYRFNGKEEQTILSEDLLDYGARTYDFSLKQWTTQDPLAEKYYHLSPYAFANNNPVRYVDPDGKDIRIAIKGNTATIHANIIFGGPDVSQSAVDAYRREIAWYWGADSNGDPWTYEHNGQKYNVVFDIHYRVQGVNEKWGLEYWDFNGENNYVAVKDTKVSSEMRNYHYGTWRKNGDGVAAHEFGHIMGLMDRYTEGGDLPGWESNTMGVNNGKKRVEQRNIDGVLNKAFDAMDQRDAMLQQYFPTPTGSPYFQKPPTDFEYFINRYNSENK